MLRALLGGAALAALEASTALAQVQGGVVNRYEALYGEPVDVSLTDLVQSPASYERRAVRTRGTLDFFPEARGQAYALREAFQNAVALVPVPEVAAEFDTEGRKLLGQEIEVTGVFRSLSAPVGGSNIRYGITFWEYLGPPEREVKGSLEATSVALESLVSRPGVHDGQTVRVVGKFRGSNLYGDLPTKSRRRSSDWVIKDDLYAVWVTGKKPKGSGWALDPDLKRDTGKWVEVVGRPETRGGITYMRALKVSLGTAPAPAAEAQPPPPPPERPKLPPVIVFALPLDGEREVSPDGRFVVQFSKDMDEQTFKGRVVLRYAGPPRPGDREFDGIRLSYDGGRRALTVDPGDVLRPGRVIELLLLPGIADVDGLPLTPRAGRSFEGVVDVLRYQVGT